MQHQGDDGHACTCGVRCDGDSTRNTMEASTEHAEGTFDDDSVCAKAHTIPKRCTS